MHSDPRPAAPFVGRRVGDRYEVVLPLGRGAFGHTYLARDLARQRDVALKLLHSRTVADLKAYELFEREASVLLALRHRGVPEFYEFFRADWEDGPTVFLIMEYVEGVSVARMIEDATTLAPARVLDVFLELLGILDYLHTRVPPILHRDIKPANVIVRPAGDPVLVDFGAVRNVFKRPDEAGSTVVGTYGYMPYEQYMGQASPASDLFALGATFLHLVTGRPPSEFMNDDGRVEVPATLPGGEPLRDAIARMLDPAPARRLPSARAVREAILAAQAGGAVAPRRPRTDPLPAGPRVRQRGRGRALNGSATYISRTFVLVGESIRYFIPRHSISVLTSVRTNASSVTRDVSGPSSV